MNIEVPYITTKKKTNLISGAAVEQSVLHEIKDRYNLSGYVVELHLAYPNQMTVRSLASEVSLRKKTKMLEAIGATSKVYAYPYGVSGDIFTQSVSGANRDQNTVGIIVQLPITKYLQGTLGEIDPIKDIDSINPNNYFWTTCATSEAALRLLEARSIGMKRIGLIGARGFVGRHIDRGIYRRGLGEVIAIDIGNSLLSLRFCETIVSAVGQPNLVKAKYLSRDGAYMGIDIGNIRSDGQFCGDFEIENMDGLLKYVTPVPGGMGPLEMVILAERIVQNAVDPTFHLDFLL